MAVAEGVLVVDGVLLRVTVDVRVPVLDLVVVFVPVGDEVIDRDTVDDGVCEPLDEDELDALEVPEDDPDEEDEADDETLGVDVGLTVIEELKVDAGVPDTEELNV